MHSGPSCPPPCLECGGRSAPPHCTHATRSRASRGSRRTGLARIPVRAELAEAVPNVPPPLANRNRGPWDWQRNGAAISRGPPGCPTPSSSKPAKQASQPVCRPISDHQPGHGCSGMAQVGAVARPLAAPPEATQPLAPADRVTPVAGLASGRTEVGGYGPAKPALRSPAQRAAAGLFCPAASSTHRPVARPAALRPPPFIPALPSARHACRRGGPRSARRRP